jgi:tRNA nucleotidyltransferase (CCA-adding enzyme)
MKVYAVGGSLRDELLGLPVADRDYVVVGATPDQLLARGFKPVGRDFPVFLHPDTHEEYALARTERKTARGYHGFQFHAAPDVTLEEDLARRDLTINAIARDEAGVLIDPFGGLADLKAGVLRHVGPAFVEDPVRILRTARFAARFGFAVAPETFALMREMVANGEVDALVPERVWQELARGLMEQNPSRMFRVLRDCGALARALPEVDALFGTAADGCDAGERVLAAIDFAAQQDAPLEVRFALLMHDVGSAAPGAAQENESGRRPRAASVEIACERLRAPHDCKDLAITAARECAAIGQALAMSAAEAVELLQRADALRKPQRFADLLDACRLYSLAHPGCRSAEYPQARRLLAALKAVQSVDAGAIASRCANVAEIQARVFQARVDAVAKSRPAGPP